MPGGAPSPTTPGTDVDEETLNRLLPPYRVILHNDDVNDMEHVIQSLMKSVPSLSEDEAAIIMVEAHTSGQASVITCPKEPAEHYRDSLESFSLTATIEPA